MYARIFTQWWRQIDVFCIVSSFHIVYVHISHHGIGAFLPLCNYAEVYSPRITSMFFEIDVRTSRSIFLNCSLYNFIQSCFYRSCTKTHSVAFFGSKRKCIFVCLFCRWSVTSGWMYITLLLERVSGLLTDVICLLHLVTGVDSWSCLWPTYIGIFSWMSNSVALVKRDACDPCYN